LAGAPEVDHEAPPVILAGAEELLPGPTLAARLSALDVTTADGWDLIEAIRGFERLVSWATAGQLAAVAALARRPAAPGTAPDPAEAAREQRLAEAHGEEHLGPDEFVVCELAMALATSRGAAAARLARADALAVLPGTFAGLRTGELSVPKAYAVVDAVAMAELPAPAAAGVEARVLGRAPEQTPGQLRAALRRAVMVADPAAAGRRHARAVRGRGLDYWELPDGLATLSLRTVAPTVRRLFETADVVAREAATAEDSRGIDARRADALVDLIDAGTAAILDPASPLDPTAETAWAPAPAGAADARAGSTTAAVGTGGDSATNPAADAAVVIADSAAEAGANAEPAAAGSAAGSAPGAPQVAAAADPAVAGPRLQLRRRPNLPVRVQVHVTVPVHTLLGLAETPGELAGYGPLPAAVTRALAFGPGATWRRLLTDDTGRLFQLAERGEPAPPPPTLAHDPSAALAEYVRTRDGTCYAPGCRQPASSTTWCRIRTGPPPPTTSTPAAAATIAANRHGAGGSPRTPSGGCTGPARPGTSTSPSRTRCQ
jgi:hypothetical protein